MIKRLAGTILLLHVLVGCSFIVELLHMEAVEITAWTPSEELIQADQAATVTIRFSSSMNRILAEDAFSLSRDNQSLQGRFSWQNADTLLIFTPEVPLETGYRFAVRVAESAEDLYGNSLSEPFDFCFATARELVPPEVLLHEPADGQLLSSARVPIRIVFSESIDPSSFYPHFSLFPSVRGGFTWDADGEQVQFTPLADYQPGQSYEVVLGREISDRSGNQLAEEIRFEFCINDSLQPLIEDVMTLKGGQILVPLQQGGAIDPSLKIEKDEGFLFAFSRSPTEEQKLDLFSVQPSAPFSLNWDVDNSNCELTFQENLCWNQVYSIEVLGLTYAFLVNGEQSVPITVTALTYCADLYAFPDENKFVLLEFAENVDFSSAVYPAFDFHLEHAPGVGVDIGSFLRAFDVSVVPACVSMTMKDIELSPLSIDPYPVPGPGQSVVRLLCSIVEDPGVTGTITFRLSTELRDSAGNHLAEDYVLLVDNN
jgi:hypothetical protein